MRRRSTPRCGRRPGARRSSTSRPPGRANGDKRLDSPSLDAVRDHWIDNVRGRGPLPALRLGRQPYGVLSRRRDRRVLAGRCAAGSSRTGSCRSSTGRCAGCGTTRKPDAVDRHEPPARRGAAGDPRHRRGAARPSGAHARCRRIRSLKSATGADCCPTSATAPAAQQVTRALLILSGCRRRRARQHDLLGTQDPRAGAAAGARDRPGVRRRPAGAGTRRACRHKSVLQVLLAHAARVERALAARDRARRTCTACCARRSRAHRSTSTASWSMRAMTARPRARRFDDGTIAEAAATTSTTRWDGSTCAWSPTATPFPRSHPTTTMQQIAGIEPQRRPAHAAISACSWSASFSTARAGRPSSARRCEVDRRRSTRSTSGGCCSRETLDCCSHRLDAWITSAAARRLQRPARPRRAGRVSRRVRLAREHRTAHARPRRARSTAGDVLHDGTDGGYIHAPGLTHAATAGVLRSGRLTHRRGDPNNEALDIDLSSTRVRDALSLLDGMRRGQSLGALLGYRLERRLHEQSGDGARARPLHLRAARAGAAARRQAHRAGRSRSRRASPRPTWSTGCG